MPDSRSSPKATARLVDISDDGDDEDDVAVTQFGQLKIGFTPGTDANHKSRRVCIAIYHVTCIHLWGTFSALIL